MNLKDRITAELIKNHNGLKASQLASLSKITKHEINVCLYSNKDLFNADDAYIWSLRDVVVSSADMPKAILSNIKSKTTQERCLCTGSCGYDNARIK